MRAYCFQSFRFDHKQHVILENNSVRMDSRRKKNKANRLMKEREDK